VISGDDASFAPLCATPLRRLGEPYGHIDLRPCPLVRYVLTLAIINFVREQGMPIVWTQSDHSAPFGGVMLKKFPTIQEDKYLWKDQPSFELYDKMLQPKEGEYRVVKHKYDAFFETDLDSILRNNRIKTIIIVGTATNVCCESTARSGFFRDYQVAFPSDCNASFDEGMHQASLKTIDMFFGRVMTSEELLEEMRNELGRNDRVAAE